MEERLPARQEVEQKTHGIQFARYFPSRAVDTVALFGQYEPAIADPQAQVRRRYGSEVLFEEEPDAMPVAEVLAYNLVTKTNQKPDVIFVVSSHLPQKGEDQRLANRVRNTLAALDMASPTATPINTKTFSAACSGTVVALDFLRQHDLTGANVLLVVDETGYRRTLPPVERDTSRSRLIFSDSGVAAQFKLGDGLTVIDSEILHNPDADQNLVMNAARSNPADAFLFVLETPWAREFGMKGTALWTIFSEHLLKDPESSIELFLQNAGNLGENTPLADLITFYLGHQASARMVNSFNKWAEKRFPNLSYVGQGVFLYGNTSSCSTLLDLEEGISSGKIRPGDIGLEVVYGGGLTSGKALIQVG